MPGPGIEPGSTEPQSVVLPLNHPGVMCNSPHGGLPTIRLGK